MREEEGGKEWDHFLVSIKKIGNKMCCDMIEESQEGRGGGGDWRAWR